MMVGAKASISVRHFIEWYICRGHVCSLGAAPPGKCRWVCQMYHSGYPV